MGHFPNGIIFLKGSCELRAKKQAIGNSFYGQHEKRLPCLHRTANFLLIFLLSANWPSIVYGITVEFFYRSPTDQSSTLV